MESNKNKGKIINPSFWETTKRLLQFMSHRKWWLLVVVILAAGSAFLSAQLPRILGAITNVIYDGISQGMQDGRFILDYDRIGQIIMILAAAYIFSAAFRYFQQFITLRIAQHTVYDLRKLLKEKMGRLPVNYFDTNATGEILSRAINDVDQIAASLGPTLTEAVTSTVQFLAVLITMLTLSGPLALIVILMIPANALIIRVVTKRSQVKFRMRQIELGELNDYVEEIYSGHSAVKVYNQADYEARIFAEKSDKLNDAAWKAEFLSGILNPLVGFSKNLVYTAVGVVGGFGVLNGSIAIGSVQAFFQYTNQFAQPFRQLANLANSIQMTIASTERVFEVLDEPEMVHPQGLTDKKNSPYKIEFDHVQFGYSPDNLLMTDFNLQVEDGEMIAVVGPTGAGKTTLINLLERFYDVSGGAIRYQGIDIRNISREALRDKFSMVLQETWLFSGTIWDNLKYGNDQVTDEQILAASKAAHVHDFVTTLPEGYQTLLTEDGTNLSQGQRQLITIARAFLSDPEIIILDEATSSVDTRTEVLIQAAMNNLLEGRTSFVVAHRLSTIRDADKIIVMDQGDVIETGNHNQLIEADGFYASLYNSQFA